MKRAILFFFLAGCGASGGKADGGADATIIGDGSMEDGTTSTDGGDEQPVDAGVDAPPATYNDITNSSNWAKFGDPSATLGFATAVFDGKYVYYAPLQGGTYTHGTAVRYDTTGQFNVNPSWSTFDMTQLNSNAKGYFGTVFDGRYVYYAPNISATGPVVNTLALRFDTMATFTSVGSWSLFDLSAVDPHAGGFGGGTFDGRYVYFVPFYSGQGFGSTITRYDTMGSFTSGSSWKVFDISTKNAQAYAHEGCVFDGRYVYFMPAATFGLIVRYDTQGTFTDGNAWSTYDVTNVNPAIRMFASATFDGRYIYLIPYPGGPWPAIFTRYDTQASFTTKASWQTFDITSWNPNAGSAFYGAVFDGRYVYLIPINDKGIVRYDTQSAFGSAASYTSFNITAYNQKSSAPYFGGAFDGQFLYLVPGIPGHPMLRFDAKTPPSQPSTWHGSFF